MTETQELELARSTAELVREIPNGARCIGALYHPEIGWYKRYYELGGKYYALNDSMAAYEERRRRLDEEMQEAAKRARAKRFRKRA